MWTVAAAADICEGGTERAESAIPFVIRCLRLEMICGPRGRSLDPSRVDIKALCVCNFPGLSEPIGYKLFVSEKR